MCKFKWKKGDPRQEILPECGNSGHVLQIKIACWDRSQEIAVEKWGSEAGKGKESMKTALSS